MFEVCTNGMQRNGCEVSTSDFFGSQGDALRFVGERLADFERGGWIHGEVTVYEPGGRLFDTFTADCGL